MSRINSMYSNIIFVINQSFLFVLQQGQGYSLPADIQYVDARWEIPVVLPLRGCIAQELNMLCHLDGYVTSLSFYLLGLNSSRTCLSSSSIQMSPIETTSAQVSSILRIQYFRARALTLRLFGSSSS